MQIFYSSGTVCKYGYVYIKNSYKGRLYIPINVPSFVRVYPEMQLQISGSTLFINLVQYVTMGIYI